MFPGIYLYRLFKIWSVAAKPSLIIVCGGASMAYMVKKWAFMAYMVVQTSFRGQLRLKLNNKDLTSKTLECTESWISGDWLPPSSTQHVLVKLIILIIISLAFIGFQLILLTLAYTFPEISACIIKENHWISPLLYNHELPEDMKSENWLALSIM